MKEKNEPKFNKVIRSCENFGLYDLMSFRYNWNEEVPLITNVDGFKLKGGLNSFIF